MKTKQIDRLAYPEENVPGLIKWIKTNILSVIPSYFHGEMRFEWLGVWNNISMDGTNQKESIRVRTFSTGSHPFFYLTRSDCRGVVSKRLELLEIESDAITKMFKELKQYRCFEIVFDVKTEAFKFKEIIHTPKTEIRSKTNVIWREEEDRLKQYFESWLKTLPVLLRGEMKIWWNNQTKLLNFNLRTKKNHLRWSSDGNLIRWVILNEEKPGQESISHFGEIIPEEEFGSLIESFVGCKSFRLFYNYNGS